MCIGNGGHGLCAPRVRCPAAEHAQRSGCSSPAISRPSRSTGAARLPSTISQAAERTQPVAMFFRDKWHSSTDSVLVVVTLALDTAVLSPVLTAWEKEASAPEGAPDEVNRRIIHCYTRCSATRWHIARRRDDSYAIPAHVFGRLMVRPVAGFHAAALLLLAGSPAADAEQGRGPTLVDDDAAGSFSRSARVTWKPIPVEP